MQRITLRWFGAMATILGFGGLATAQYTPAIPQAPAMPAYQPAQQTAGFSTDAPWMKALASQTNVPAQPADASQYLLVQAVGQPVPPAGAKPGTSLPPTTPGSFPYNQPQGPSVPPPPTVAAGQPPAPPPPGYNPGPFATYGAPPQPRNTAFGAGMAPVPYNEFCPQCANGCGSLKSDLGFVLGSCKSFFNTCGPIPCNGFWTGKGNGECKKCQIFPYGHPYAHPFNTCRYDSYMNH